ncbi:MAG: YceI family protein [Proteobacteria bacterium]|nr:YceI family protein [Pseudomonadota bacterium]
MLLLLASLNAEAAAYAIDASHSQVGFSVTHMTISTVRGEFGEVSGTIEFDPEDIAATKVEAKVGLGSVDTNNVKRDDHLKGADFFDADKFTEATFTNSKVDNIAKDGSFDVIGSLDLHGVQKEITFHFAPVTGEITDPWGNTKRGGSASTVINRQDFGISWNSTMDAGGLAVGDEVTIQVDLELVKAKAE